MCETVNTWMRWWGDNGVSLFWFLYPFFWWILYIFGGETFTPSSIMYLNILFLLPPFLIHQVGHLFRTSLSYMEMRRCAKCSPGSLIMKEEQISQVTPPQEGRKKGLIYWRFACPKMCKDDDYQMWGILPHCVKYREDKKNSSVMWYISSMKPVVVALITSVFNWFKSQVWSQSQKG